jgi:hypothetical protein
MRGIEDAGIAVIRTRWAGRWRHWRGILDADGDIEGHFSQRTGAGVGMFIGAFSIIVDGDSDGIPAGYQGFYRVVGRSGSLPFRVWVGRLQASQARPRFKPY